MRNSAGISVSRRRANAVISDRQGLRPPDFLAAGLSSYFLHLFGDTVTCLRHTFVSGTPISMGGFGPDSRSCEAFRKNVFAIFLCVGTDRKHEVMSDLHRIKVPWSRRWEIFCYRRLPLMGFATSLIVVFWLWNRESMPLAPSGTVEGIRPPVATTTHEDSPPIEFVLQFTLRDSQISERDSPARSDSPDRLDLRPSQLADVSVETRMMNTR
jgi:hypothetical protein